MLFVIFFMTISLENVAMSNISESAEWQDLQSHYLDVRGLHMRDLFAKDSARFKKFSVSDCGILLDYSKNRITDETMQKLFALAKKADVLGQARKMFNGEKINTTEDRAVLHTALRLPRKGSIQLDGEEIVSQVHAEADHAAAFVDQVRNKEWTGHTGRPIDTIVNIGIGGSDLGPLMVCEALKPWQHEDLNFHFVSNVDGSHIAEVIAAVDMSTTLFIIASKTFTTQETLANARSAREAFLATMATEDDIARHFVAVSTNSQAVTEFGIDANNMFRFWDWVGGRYSLWSSIGLSIRLSVGNDNYNALLAGAHEMDRHFVLSEYEQNLPVIMAMLGVWYGNFFNARSHAIEPYDQYLHRFPAYLQQLDMESNGKRVQIDGSPVTYSTGPVIWGEPGTNGQHAFFQLIHQGTDLIPADFIAPVNSQNRIGEHHQMLLANFFAQTEAMMRGKTLQQVEQELREQGMSDSAIADLAPHKVFEGNRPSNTVMVNELTPSALGSLIALYEHKVFVQGKIWGVNSFDQWGVELGKQLATTLLSEFKSGQIGRHDSSTIGLLEHWLNNRA